MQETHRSGFFKQSNKAHKHGRHRSKGAVAAIAKGKISRQSCTMKTKTSLSRNERRHCAVQMRTKKREETMMRKRQIGGMTNSPFLISIIPLGFETEPQALLNLMMSADSDATVTCAQEDVFHVSIPRWKQRFALVIPRRNNLYSILDALKVSDTAIFVMSASSDNFIDEAGEKILTCALAQGLPATAVALIDLPSIAIKKHNAIKQSAQKAISLWLPDDKVISLDKNGDALNLLRKLGSQKLRTVNQRDRRPYILAEQTQFIAEDEADFGTLLVSGYLRGQTLSSNRIIHIPGWGDYQMAQIDGPPDPHPMEKRNGMDQDEIEVLQVANPDRQTSLLAELEPDPMDAEQTWPTQDEMEQVTMKKKSVKRVPKGTSDYQASWIPDDSNDDNDDEDEEDDQEESMDMESENESDQWDDACEVLSNAEGDVGEKYDDELDIEEEGEALAKLKAMREEAAFPDEVDTPQDIPARERFAKYRGLASFRTSPWDTKENLPKDYARIFQFENFDRTKRRILRDQEDQLDGVQPGGYIRIHVKGVSKALVAARMPGQPLVVVGLHLHEHQMSLMNLVVKRSSHSIFTQDAVKSKDSVIVHCGFRRFRACPIYSQHTNGTKHKYERFFQPESTMVASLYAPITFPPASVLFFTETGGSLLATGRLLSANPDRLVIKRVILSGHPFRVLKRHAIVRFMFFNREDIEWFKPVELHTKYGRRGHIREALGTHGHMKAIFDDQLKSQDTVLMTLYKRVFPPWRYDPHVNEQPPLYKLLPPIHKEME